MRPAQRLRQRQDFAAVYRRGRPIRNDLLIMRAVRTNEPVSRFGFTTSRVVGNAVVRNRVRRRMREVIPSLPIVSGWDVVFNSRVKIATATYDQIRSRMSDLLERSELLEEPSS